MMGRQSWRARLMRWLWLPERVAALEARVAALEAARARPVTIRIPEAEVAAARERLSRLGRDQSSSGS